MFAALFAAPAFAQNPDAGDVTTGLIGHWKLDETSGSQITDSSSNTNHGTWVDNENTDVAEEANDGRISGSLVMDSDDRITIPAIGAYNVGTNGSFSISFWFKTSDPSISFLSAGAGNQIIAMTLDGGRVRFRMRDSLGNSLFFPYNCPYGCRDDDQWHLAVMVLDRGNNSAHVYIDDVEEQSFSDVSSVVGDMGAVVNIIINNGSSEIDDVRYYNRALSTDDIALLYASFPGNMTCNAAYEAVMIYNQDEKVMQYCDGTDWISMGKGKSCGTPSCGGDPSERIAFLTPAYAGSLGGLAGADTICQNTANAAGLQGTYMAWLAGSTAASAPASRFTEQSSVPYVRPDGLTIADNWADLTDGTLTNSIIVQANGNTAGNGNGVRTNVDTDGTQLTTTDHCSDFTVSNASTSAAGNRGLTNAGWTNVGPFACNNGLRLYCFEQGPPAAPTGCSSPAGKAGEVDYNFTEGVMQYCNGSNWINMGPKIAGGGSSASSLSPSATTTGLVGHWPLDDTNATALATVGPNGTMVGGLSGAADSVNGKVGSALNFDDTDDGIDIGDNFGFERTDPFSIAAWVKTDVAAPAGLNHIAGKFLSPSPFSGYHLTLTATTYEFGLTSNGGNGNFMNTTVPRAQNTQWQHILMTYDGSSNASGVTAYINGVPQTVTVTQNNLTGSILTASHFTIGLRDLASRPFGGDIDDVRVYNRELTATEAGDLYKYSSLALHLPLDETSGTTASDSSGNGFDGTVNGTDFATSTTAGKSGNALTFDGTNDYINTSYNTDFASGGFTMSAWARTSSSAIMRILSKHTGGVDQKWFLFINGQIEVGISNASGGITSAGSYNDGEWHLFTAVVDDTNMYLYVDGVQTDSSTHDNTFNSNAANWHIGRRNDGAEYFNGDIDDVRIYTRALSGSEVASLYANTGGNSQPVSGCPNIGDVCDDGSVYAGITPDGNAPMYTTPADVPNSGPWGGLAWGSQIQSGAECLWPAYTDIPCTTGKTNTQTLDTHATGTFPAASYCANLNAHGQNDWYLPAFHELYVLYTNRAAIGGFDTSGTAGTEYWSSSGDQAAGPSYGPAWRLNFGTGGWSSVLRANTVFQRCVRSGGTPPGGTCINPPGVPGEMIYNDDNNAMQYCVGSTDVAPNGWVRAQ